MTIARVFQTCLHKFGGNQPTESLAIAYTVVLDERAGSAVSLLLRDDYDDFIGNRNSIMSRLIVQQCIYDGITREAVSWQ
jgi:hypothetical protein